MILRHWKGIARVEEADNYIRYLETETFPQISTIQGFIEAKILKRIVEQGVEFLIISTWETIESIKQFAGDVAHTAVVPPNVQVMMVEFDSFATHYEIARSYPEASNFQD
jgi:heme-degrading monooxygenase HmoA